jgi:hypothetical protein
MFHPLAGCGKPKAGSVMTVDARWGSGEGPVPGPVLSYIGANIWEDGPRGPRRWTRPTLRSCEMRRSIGCAEHRLNGCSSGIIGCLQPYALHYSTLPNGLEMSRLAGEGRADWVETRYTGSVRSAQDQTQVKDTPASRPESISGRWQRDSAGQVASIELLDAQDLLVQA